jgi:hypothetical protein
MGLAVEQEVPLQQTEKSVWSIRKLFPFAEVTGALARTFINVFDVLLGFSILIIGLCELANREVSWFFYILTMLLLVCAFVERRGITLETPKQPK